MDRISELDLIAEKIAKSTSEDFNHLLKTAGLDLSFDLIYVDLKDVDLRRVVLRYANLSGADLRGASLNEANFSGATLSGADLRGADLRGANLKGTDLSGANLSGADLRGAGFRRTKIHSAIIEGAKIDVENVITGEREQKIIDGPMVENKSDEIWSIILDIAQECNLRVGQLYPVHLVYQAGASAGFPPNEVLNALQDLKNRHLLTVAERATSEFIDLIEQKGEVEA